MARIEHGELTSYDQCAAKLGKRDSRKLRNNVYLKSDDKDFIIVYHHTIIIRYRLDGSIALDSGGHRTSSTRANLNRYTGFYIWQRKWVWYIELSSGTVLEFRDGITIVAQPEQDAPAPALALDLEKQAVEAILSLFPSVPINRFSDWQTIRQRTEAWIAHAVERIEEEFDVEAG